MTDWNKRFEQQAKPIDMEGQARALIAKDAQIARGGKLLEEVMSNLRSVDALKGPDFECQIWPFHDKGLELRGSFRGSIGFPDVRIVHTPQDGLFYVEGYKSKPLRSVDEATGYLIDELIRFIR